MNILVISSILPIPSAISDNDFIYHLYGKYRELQPDSGVVIIKPVKYDFNIRTIWRRRTRLQKLKGRLQWEVRGFRVEIFPFYSAWTIRSLHALVSRSVYYLNRKRIRDLFKEYDFDIVHARFIFADGFLAHLISKNYSIPYFVSTHNELFYFNHFYSRKIASRILKQASYVLPANIVNIEYFKSLGISKLQQTPHGFHEHFLRDQRQGANEKVHLLTVCTLIKLKNIDKVLLALHQLKEEFRFRYTIIGKGPEQEPLEELADQLGMKDDVVFIDHVPHEQIADEMYKHDVFVMPSYFETFGRVYFEVMAMGIPVICAKNSGIYGLFEDKEEGFAIDHTRLEELTSVLQLLIGNRQERLRVGRNGQELVKNYTWANVVKSLHNKYISSIHQTS